MEAPAMPVEGLPAGTRFGPWTCVRPLAAGGMAELYLAASREDPLQPPVVIKRLLPHLSWDPEFVAMFLAEVKIAAGLAHPSIAAVLDFGVGEGGHYFAMEYLHGRDLRAVLKDAAQAGILPMGVALGIVLDVAAGLSYAHTFTDPGGQRLEVVHRDVSPSNVMVCHDGRVKLLDFGIARVTAQTRQTRAGTVKGKVGYMSPEQCRGDTVDRRSDVFGLGILLYELTVGRRAFFGDNEFAVMNRVVDGDYVRPCAVVPDYPDALEAIIDRALAPDPAARFATAHELAEAVRTFSQAMALDVGPGPRQRWMSARFGQPPLPVIEPGDLEDPERAARGGGRRTAVLVVTALLVGAGGFVLGGWVRDDAPAVDPAAQAVPEAIAIPISTPTPITGGEPPAENLGMAETAVLDDAAEPEDDTLVLEADPEPEAETGTSAPSRRKTRARARRGARSKPEAAPVSPPASPAEPHARPSGEELLLPSRRNR
jgi:hypothetical protein